MQSYFKLKQFSVSAKKKAAGCVHFKGRLMRGSVKHLCKLRNVTSAWETRNLKLWFQSKFISMLLPKKCLIKQNQKLHAAPWAKIAQKIAKAVVEINFNWIFHSSILEIARDKVGISMVTIKSLNNFYKIIYFSQFLCERFFSTKHLLFPRSTECLQVLQVFSTDFPKLYSMFAMPYVTVYLILRWAIFRLIFAVLLLYHISLEEFSILMLFLCFLMSVMDADKLSKVNSRGC